MNSTNIHTMDVIKISTAGSVDDGKSTLIGRLLYDTNSLLDDKVAAIKKTSKKMGYDYLDFSLATDGLIAEREQGITIDVAHVYFSTSKRRYIIADTPGHVEYTRNMITGASTSQVSIVLIDARNGVVEQTRRHFFINNLIHIKDIVVVINKMDLVDYKQNIFDDIKNQFQKLKKNSSYADLQIHYIPINALRGDNVVVPSSNMPWYKGPTVLSHLESLQIDDLYLNERMRFPVQTVIRPKSDTHHDFRGYAGRVYGNTLHLGDDVTILPSNIKTKVKAIHSFNLRYSSAPRRSSVTIELQDDVSVVRGDMIVKSNEIPKEGNYICAKVCWMDKTPLRNSTKYILQHNTQTIPVKIKEIQNIIKTDFSGTQAATRLELNEIGTIKIMASKKIYYDLFLQHKTNGSFILIDCHSHTTVAVGIIIE